MCRLAAWLGPQIALEDVIVRPDHSLIEQSHAATEAKLAVNGDGFGFAWYSDNGDLGLYRDVLPAWTDGNLLSLSSMIRSHLFLAHVRASTFGHVSRSNCHPFISERWSFMHNGKIGNFAHHRRRLEAQLSDSRYSQRVGNTDSELFFLLLLDHGLETAALNAIKRVLSIFKALPEVETEATRVAAVLSDGKRIMAIRYSTDNHSPTLYYKRQSDGGLFIASEPLHNDGENWNCLPESSMLVASNSTQETIELAI